MTGHTAMPSDERKREVAEQAALLALGLLPEDEARELEALLASGDEDLVEAARAGRAAAASVGLGAPSAPPPEGAKERLFARLRSEEAAAAPSEDHQVWKGWAAEGDVPPMLFVPGGDGGWEETGFAGVRVRRLFADAQGGRVTMLVKMEPGTSYPGHRHGGAEECFVVEGSIHVGDLLLEAGDYQRAAAGSVHGEQRTDEGCTLLISSSQHDEFLSE